MLWKPWVYSDLDEMRKDMDALSEMLGYAGDYSTSFPLMNAYETKDEFVLAAEVPGVKREKLAVRCDDNTLTICGERSAPAHEGHHRHILRQEREAGSFEKIFRFHSKVEPGGIKAKLVNGILLVRIPRAEHAKPKPIDIQV